jgi:hypothetical protein
MAAAHQKQIYDFIPVDDKIIRLDQIRYLRIIEKKIHIIYIDGTTQKLEFPNALRAHDEYAKLYERLVGVKCPF